MSVLPVLPWIALATDIIQLVQARRNYAIVSYLQTGELEFDFRVEKFQGAGETVSYAVKAPAPRWQAAA